MYRTILSILYPIFFVLVIPSQILLIYIILRHSPKYLHSFKYVLLVNSVCQTITVFICCLLQTRQVSNLTPIEVWCYGPMRYFDAIVPYSMYFVAQITTLTSSFLIFLTIYLKYEAAKTFYQIRSHMTKVVVILFIPVFAALGAEIWIVIANALPPDVQDRFRLINANVTDHSVIGYITLKTIPSLMVFFIVSGSVIILPPIGFYVRRKILNYVSSSLERSSTFKKLQNKSFINGLTLQAFLPLICYIPIFICFFVLIETKSEFLFEQYFISIFTILPTIFDPYITMYSVSSYRKQIKIWLRMEKVETTVWAAPHSQIIL